MTVAVQSSEVIRNQEFPNLRSPIRIGGISVKNRIVCTAHGTSMAEKGLISDRLVAYLEARAAGGAGLVIVEAASVHWTGVGSSNWLRCDIDACIPGYAATAAAVHRHGAAIFGQLHHPGRGDIGGTTDDGTVGVAFGPSSILSERNVMMPRALSVLTIEDIVQSYGSAATRMLKAGLDGIEVMAHHGHLLSQFMNSRVNRRTDAYGGSFENRLRIVRSVLAAVRDAVGRDVPVGIRVSVDEMDGSGLRPSEASEICQALGGLGVVDYVSLNSGSCSSLEGMIHVVPPMTVEAGYIAKYTGAIREVLSVPVIATGRINTPQIAEAMIADGKADLCGMARAMICDPRFAAKAFAGEPDRIRACIACNQACIGHTNKGASISCIQNPLSGRELLYRSPGFSSRRRKILVAGGGPAGMKAAVTAAERGHHVQLFEQRSALGGQVQMAQSLPGRFEFGGLTTNLFSELRALDVEIHLGAAVTRDTIQREQPDAVILATGARPHFPSWIEPGEGVVHAWDLLGGKIRAGASVVIADGRLEWTGLGLAEMLVRSGSRVRLCTTGAVPGSMAPISVRDSWMAVLHRLGVEVFPYLRVGGCDERTAFFEHVGSRETVVFEDVDTLVIAYGGAPDTRLEQSLIEFPDELHVVGDCASPRTAEEAVFEGFKAGLAV